MSRAALALLALALAGCGSDSPPPPPARTPSSAAAPAAEPAPAPDSTVWTVSPDGAGPVRVGMDFAALAPFLTTPADTVDASEGCRYMDVRGAPDGLHFMVEDGRLVRVEVREGDTPTQAGARIGDPESRIAALYPGLRVLPHKYTDGHYLVVLPGAPADTLHRLVFETDGSRVTLFRAGLYPPVGYVERCG
ncbi:MAG TPA: hypothetical protein VFI96_00085 [Longimicrobiaceae bacterium]|nr:hypothetical protein [Longimicrobiaceae bacterium]